MTCRIGVTPIVELFHVDAVFTVLDDAYISYTAVSGVISDVPQCRVQHHSANHGYQMFRSPTVRLSINISSE